MSVQYPPSQPSPHRTRQRSPLRGAFLHGFFLGLCPTLIVGFALKQPVSVLQVLVSATVPYLCVDFLFWLFLRKARASHVQILSSYTEEICRASEAQDWRRVSVARSSETMYRDAREC